MIQPLRKLFITIFVSALVVGSMTACSSGGGSGDDEDKKSDTQSWDSMRWDQGTWK